MQAAEDLVRRFRALMQGDRIARIVEYWPEPFAPRPDRARWVERMAAGALA